MTKEKKVYSIVDKRDKNISFSSDVNIDRDTTNNYMVLRVTPIIMNRLQKNYGVENFSNAKKTLQSLVSMATQNQYTPTSEDLDYRNPEQIANSKAKTPKATAKANKSPNIIDVFTQAMAKEEQRLNKKLNAEDVIKAINNAKITQAEREQLLSHFKPDTTVLQQPQEQQFTF
jgi:hypothetical protein